MTRDEILNMSAGREMDALIAERVMGWTPWVEKRGEYDYVIWQRNGDKEPWFSHRGWETHKSRYSKLIKYDSHYHIEVGLHKFSSGGYDEAFEVVEKMKSDGWEFYFEWKDKPWALFENDECLLDKYADADTVPLAICKAALLTTLE
jgi:hypothetical protein